MNYKTTINYGGTKKGHSQIKLELKETDKGFVFSASGLHDFQYNRHMKMWDYCGGGQCLDSIAKEYPTNRELAEIVRLWKLYHLNDMNAGTPLQSAYLKTLGKYQGYEWACEELEKVGLYNHDGYKYGSAWLFNKIPQTELNKIIHIIERNNSKADEV